MGRKDFISQYFEALTQLDIDRPGLEVETDPQTKGRKQRGAKKAKLRKGVQARRKKVKEQQRRVDC